MNKRIEEAYAKRPKRWVFELVIALITVALLIWSGTAVETTERCEDCLEHSGRNLSSGHGSAV